MVLVIDDAQELDDASALLLDRVVDHGGAFIVFTARVGRRRLHGRRPEVDETSGSSGSRSVPLPERDLRTLAEMAAGGPIDGASLQAIVESSRGNVLFLRELIYGALESGVLASELGLWHLKGSLSHSPRLRDLIEERLTGLSTKRAGSAWSSWLWAIPFTLTLLERLVPLEALEGTGRARPARRAGQRHAGPELRLNHPFYGDVVRAQLPSLRRILLFRSLADAADVAGGWRVATRAGRGLAARGGGGGRSRSPRPRPGPPCGRRTIRWPFA